MAKEMVYFNATKKIETITIHYNNKLDGTFVDDVATNIKNIAAKMGSKVNLKDPKEFDSIQVFVYPSIKLFNSVFGGEIEKRFYSRKRSLEDLYVVKDSDGNIHIVSPRGMAAGKQDAFKKILVMKVLGEYMDEKEKKNAERLLKVAMQPKEENKEEQDIEELDQAEEEIDIEEEEREENEEELEEAEEELEDEELSEEELEELITTETVIEQIDENDEESSQAKEEIKNTSKDEARQWLHFGWLAYVRGKLKKEKEVAEFAKHVSKNGVKKLNKLSKTKLFENYNFSEEYACALVEYIVTVYGLKKFQEFYENPKDIQGIFGVSKFNFNNDVKAFVYRNYTNKEMKMDMDEKGVSEITEVHFEKGGGVDITKDIEKDAPAIEEV